VSPLFLVNWHSVAGRFRALMWALAAVLAVVVLVHSVQKPKQVRHPAPAATALLGGLRGRP
jgi:hypothetical protein